MTQKEYLETELQKLFKTCRVEVEELDETILVHTLDHHGDVIYRMDIGSDDDAYVFTNDGGHTLTVPLMPES